MSNETPTSIPAALTEIINRLAAIESQLAELTERPSTDPARQHYSVAEVGQILSKSPYTVREWCRQGRIHALKRATGRGRSKDWVIARDEVTRIQDQGLLATTMSPAVTVSLPGHGGASNSWGTKSRPSR